MRMYPLGRSEGASRIGGAHSDNLVIVPASMLLFKREWQRLANQLPSGNTLVVVPEDDTPLRWSMRCVAAQLRQRGHRVTTISTSHLVEQPIAA